MTLDTRAIRERCDAATKGPWLLDGAWYVCADGDSPNQVKAVANLSTRTDNPLADGAFIAHARTDLPAALDALDAAESRYAQLSALVDTWQRRFNLELQRALDAESELAEAQSARATNALGWEQARNKLDAAESELRETREALAAHQELKAPSWDTKIRCACGERFTSRCEWALHHAREARAFLARLPTEEE